MSQIQPVGTPEVRAAIARAAQATGVDFDYLLAQARLESSLDPSAQAGTSSAAGLYQFTGGTWAATLQRHGAEHGLNFSRDPSMRGAMMALRFDPGASALMAGELANDNKAALNAALGRQPDTAELYLAHFLGADGASRFLSALSANPGQSAAALLPAAAAANRGIFYDKNGAARSLDGVMELLRGRLNTAMESPSGAEFPAETNIAWADIPRPGPSVQQAGAIAGPIAHEFHAARQAAALPSRPSMADTLRDTFALALPSAPPSAPPSAAPGFVRAAYDQMKAMGL